MSHPLWLKIDNIIIPPMLAVEIAIPNWMPLFSHDWQQELVFFTQAVTLVYVVARTVDFVIDRWILNRRKKEP